MQLDRSQHQRNGDQHNEGGLEVQQADHDVSAEPDTNADSGRQVTAGAAVRIRRRGRRLSHYTSSNSASLCLRTSSMASVCFLVAASSCFSARATSSSPASLSLTIRSRASLAVRRAPRTETRASSALCLASLMYSLRRSSVSSGRTIRMVLPSLEGLTPRSELRIDFSMPLKAFLSYGVISITRASCAWKVANCCSGVGAP